MNYAPIENDLIGIDDTSLVSFEDIVPANFREELAVMNITENRSSWRTGDIVLEIFDIVANKGLEISRQKIYQAVAYYRGLSAGRVKNISLVCRHFPPDKREFAKPFTHYERMMTSLPMDKAVEALRLSEKIERETGENIIPSRMLEIVKAETQPTKEDLIRNDIENIITDIAGLKQKIPQCSAEILEIVGILNGVLDRV